MMNPYSLSHLWEVLLLFLIPIGGGIPAGVLLAQKHGFYWPVMILLYFISDLLLALAFEPLLMLLIKFGKRVPRLQHFSENFKAALLKTTSLYGHGSGVFALIIVAFGVDPMTGRTIAVAAGHGFVTGWLIAITGDMLYFTLLMISTLWLNSLLGDGTWTMLIILALMILIPLVIKKIKNK